MIKRTAIVLITYFCFLMALKAQDSLTIEPQHLLCLSTGLSNHMIRDDIISPLIYKGNQFPILLTYEYRGIKSRHTIMAFYDNLELASSITDKSSRSHYAENMNIFLEYSYCRKAFIFEGINTNCYVGGGLSCFLNLRNFYYSRQANGISGEPMVNLAFDALLETSVSKSTDDFLSFNIHVPIVSYVLMSDRYNNNVSEMVNELDYNKNLVWQVLTKGKFVTLNKLLELQTELSYTTFVSKYIGFEFQYKFQFYSFAEYKDLFHVRYVNNQFLVGFIIIL